jgi:hypothetical protein
LNEENLVVSLVSGHRFLFPSLVFVGRRNASVATPKAFDNAIRFSSEGASSPRSQRATEFVLTRSRFAKSACVSPLVSRAARIRVPM